MFRIAARIALAVAVTATLGGLATGPSLAASGVGHVDASRAMPSSVAGQAQSVIRDLEKQGYEVSVGYPLLYTQDLCDRYTYETFHNCFANNPASPYVIPVVKSWPDEYVDPSTVNGFGKTRPGYSATYRLDEREAIVILGEMPPEGRYMGLQSWVFSQERLDAPPLWDTVWEDLINHQVPFLSQYLFGTVPRDSSRLLSFSSLSNNINDVVMTAQSDEAPFGQVRTFVITPDQTMDGVVRAALENAGMPGDDIFTEPIPPDAVVEFPQPATPPDDEAQPIGPQPIGPIGLDKSANDFLTALRYAMPEDERAADTWRSSLPLTVLRVREAPSSDREPVPFDTFTADERGGVDEHAPDLGLTQALDDLVAAVCARADAHDLDLEGGGCDSADDDAVTKSEMKDILTDLGQDGPYCRYVGMDCEADGQDASYFIAGPRPLDDGQVYAAVGTLATETGNATYVGLGVNDASMLKGAANLSDDDLTGSAVPFEQEAGQDFSKLFVRFFARDCSAIEDLTSGACTAITEDVIPLSADPAAPGDRSLHGQFSTSLRSYVDPSNPHGRGPDPTLQLTPRILGFFPQE
ncbi:hypothetical protein P0L94_15290 [Microbacter sp. GSS18]|nr:hypothetical protein P0L94_15290 [Microbacter sp. GSS18]